MKDGFFFIKGKRILGILISIILFTQQLMPVSIANAEGGVSTNKDVTDSIQFLEDVKLLEPSEGSTIGEDLTKKENIDINSKVSILYSFRMPERDESNLDNNINEEDFAYIDIPEEINMSDITLPITTKESENIVNIGTLTLSCQKIK